MNILLTSVGYRNDLVHYFKQAVGDSGHIFASNSVYTATLAYADGYTITPEIYHPDYIPFLLRFCKEHNITAIISLFDIDLMILARNKERFRQDGIQVIVADERAIEICNDKYKTFLFLKENGINTPQSYLSKQECLQDIAQGKLDYPIILKPRWGMGSIGIYIADNEEEVNVFEKKLKRDIFKTYLKFESNQDPDAAIIFQQKIDGNEFGLDVINDLNANYIITSAKRKLAMRAGETDTAITVKIPALEDVGKQLAGLMKHVGNLDVDCFLVGETPYVLEMNCRFGGQFPFSYLAGVNLPQQIVHWLNHEETDMSLLMPQPGILAAKDFTPITYDFVCPSNKTGIEFSFNTVDAKELEELFTVCDNYFSPPLSQRANIRECACKSRTFGYSLEAKCAGKLVGVIMIYANDMIQNKAYIPFVMVKKELQGQGIAGRLLQNALIVAQLRGMKKVVLRTDVGNHTAIHLYQKYGFIETSHDTAKIYFAINL